ncbi:MAG TPA: glycogen synthase [Terriglobales bacterium]|nr:glycogen synthase [Terriglobales bacterium]
MRVALFTREYPPYVYGGAGVHVEYLSRELAKLMEVEVHCFGDQGSSSGALQVIGHEPWKKLDSGVKFQAALEAMSVNLDSVQNLDDVDVVHTHTWYAAMAGFWAKKLYGMPFVLTTHSLEPLRAWKAEQLGSGYQMSSWMEKTAIESADAVIAVSHGTKADILRAYPSLPPNRIHVIYNGIDLDEYRRDPGTQHLDALGVDRTLPFVLFVGRITRQKGVTHLVEAIHHLPAGTQVVLCAGAPDTPEIATEMREKVARLQQTHPHVRWIEKMVSKPEVIQLYSHAAVFCCPSIYEPFGIINLEAMACGTAVVASATGGIKEVVLPGETGELVPLDQDPDTNAPRKPEQFARDLAAAIAKVLASPALQKQYGKAGRARVEATFSWQAIAEQTATMYRRVGAARAKMMGDAARP